ncbi:protein FAR1-RELATED SEQUENCE 6-like isoform X2 [Macadamia integrifolia]|uniref:protein FAR1-RELATED SEQUENCE 6-like isoform X2 n=1 Tax=Macadamia integrifolia TaxID=60698 RepID=UPI001C4E5CEA|nr:protein FAR1-RELATED SEQUENCE 6-like isoform X2 [Macadamia integrifolia]XP_042505012.1 protein FAR1-RELATED SEQUENCE 6-like isoform X2 [Macadamia integrifolia]
MGEICLNSEPLAEDGADKPDAEETDCGNSESTGENHVRKEEPVPPGLGMEFESFEDAYEFYNKYAEKVGFGIRIRSSYFKKQSKEKYAAVLCCSCEGFKRSLQSHNKRPEVRTGCQAMVRIKLRESKGWQVIEVKLEHNHVTNPAGSQFYRSHKSAGSGTKGKLQLTCDAGIHTCKYQSINGKDVSVVQCKCSKLEKGDAQAVYEFLCRMQQKSPNFFYLMDLDEDGRLGNVFWADARCRAACEYFGDVVAFDTTYLTHKYDLPFAPFVGVNNHGQYVLLGCGLLLDKTSESFIWLFKAWLACMSGRIPNAIITDQCKVLKKAVMEVFPGACHRLCLWHIMQKVPEKLQNLREYRAVKRAMERAVYDSWRVDEFELAWEDMIQQNGVGDNEWLQTLYEYRHQWVPAFLKGTSFAGMSTTQRSESINSYFDGFVHARTSLKEFLDNYELALEKRRSEEFQADLSSIHSKPVLKTRSYYEKQLSEVYTMNMFKKFQNEVEEMLSCFNTTQVHVDGPVITYTVKERAEGNESEIKDYEVLYNTVEVEVHCICNQFNFKGYLCRHALSVLHYNGIEEIPSRYILPRWRKDFKCIYVLENSANDVDVDDPVTWYDQLYKRAIQVVEGGVISQEHFKVALQALEESLSKVYDIRAFGSKKASTVAQRNPTKSDNAKEPSQVKRRGRPKQNGSQCLTDKGRSTERAPEVDNQRAESNFQVQPNLGNPISTPESIYQPVAGFMVPGGLMSFSGDPSLSLHFPATLYPA